MSPNLGFPKGFLWGAATSAYQIEGSPLADGAGPSNWHRFAHTPGTRDGRRQRRRRVRPLPPFPEDVALMQSLSLNAYRFSVSWSRVFPEGVGRVNEKGLDFYRRLVDALLHAGIEPFGTFFHWDLPAALEDRGGFLNRDVAGWFADYASAVCRALPGVGSLGDAERAVGRDGRRLRARHPRAGTPQRLRSAGRRAQSSPRARGGRHRLPRGRRAAPGPRRQPRAEVPGDGLPRRRRGRRRAPTPT